MLLLHLLLLWNFLLQKNTRRRYGPNIHLKPNKWILSIHQTRASFTFFSQAAVSMMDNEMRGKMKISLRKDCDEDSDRLCVCVWEREREREDILIKSNQNRLNFFVHFSNEWEMRDEDEEWKIWPVSFFVRVHQRHFGPLTLLSQRVPKPPPGSNMPPGNNSQ